MATYKTRGIIIGRHNFGEADRIMVILTPESGVIRAVAKGVRRIKSKMAGHLELFSESELMLAKGRNLDIITSARLQNHPDITSDYDKMRLAYLAAEMVNRLGSDGDQTGLFEIMQELFVDLSKGQADSLSELWFKLRLLDQLGYRPELGECIVCHTSDPTLAYRFNIELGGIVDEGCGSSDSHPMTTEQIKFWRLLLSQTLETVRRIENGEELAKQTMPLCNLFYDHTFGQRFRSAQVLS